MIMRNGVVNRIRIQYGENLQKPAKIKKGEWE